MLTSTHEISEATTITNTTALLPNPTTSIDNVHASVLSCNTAASALAKDPTSIAAAKEVQKCLEDASQGAQSALVVVANQTMRSTLASLITALSAAIASSVSAVATPTTATVASVTAAMAVVVAADVAVQEAQSNPNTPIKSSATVFPSSPTSSSPTSTCVTCVGCTSPENPALPDDNNTVLDVTSSNSSQSSNTTLTRRADTLRGLICGQPFDVPAYTSWSAGATKYSLIFNYQISASCNSRLPTSPLFDFALRFGTTVSACLPVLDTGYVLGANSYATEDVYEIQQVKIFMV